MINEAQITEQIRHVLRISKVWHWKNWSGPMTYPKGIADILGCVNGRMLAIEIKKPGWSPPAPGTKAYKHFKEQEDFLLHVNQNGGIGFFASDVETVIKELGLNIKIYPLFARKGF